MKYTEESENLRGNITDEVKRLKRKVNALLCIRDELLGEIKTLKYSCQELEKVSNGLDKSSYDFLMDVYVVNIMSFLKKLQMENLWLDYKNNTVITREYYRIEKEDFEELLQEFLDPNLNADTFTGLMGRLGIMKIAPSRNSLYLLHSVVINGKSRRVYLIRKTAVDIFSDDLRN